MRMQGPSLRRTGLRRRESTRKRHSLQLYACAHFREYCTEDGRWKIRRDGDEPMCTQEQDRLVAERIGERRASFRAADHDVGRPKPIPDVEETFAAFDPLLVPVIVEPGHAQRIMHLPAFVVGSAFEDAAVEFAQRVGNFERSLIMAALDKTDWNQKKAAELLSVNPTTLSEKLKRLKIKFPPPARNLAGTE